MPRSFVLLLMPALAFVPHFLFSYETFSTVMSTPSFTPDCAELVQWLKSRALFSVFANSSCWVTVLPFDELGVRASAHYTQRVGGQAPDTPQRALR